MRDKTQKISKFRLIYYELIKNVIELYQYINRIKLIKIIIIIVNVNITKVINIVIRIINK